MRRLRLLFSLTACAGLCAVAVAPGPAAARKPSRAPQPVAVVALIDTGINPYSPAFRDKSPLAYKHPSTYIPGYPKDAEALPITLDVPYDEAFEKDEDLWIRAQRNKLYWFPGTRIVGAISLGGGGCPSSEAPPPVNGTNCREHVILDDDGHGTMTASRAAGSRAPSRPTPASSRSKGSARARWRGRPTAAGSTCNRTRG